MAVTEQTGEIDEQKLGDFMNQMVGELGATLGAALVVIGDQLGLYKAMAGAGPLTSARLAERTGTTERYVREWLNAQAAGGYVTYDPATKTYTLPPEHALALADESSPFFVCGAFQGFASLVRDEPKIREAFKSGAGVGWHEHHHDLFEGTERFFRPGYNTHLVDSWIPALDGVEAKLRAGARVADVGCGLGASTILMAKAYPKSELVGFDYHAESIEAARGRARDAGVADRVRFEVAPASGFAGTYDLVCMFDCLHDMGDPVGAARHVHGGARDGRHVADRRAVRERQRRGQPQPGRPRLLRRLDARLHARLAVAGGRARARRSGGRGAPARRRRPPAGSRGSAAPPRRRSTSCSKRGRELYDLRRRCRPGPPSARGSPTRPGSSRRAAYGSRTSPAGMGRRPFSCCPAGRSCTSGSGRRRCRISPATAASSRSTRAATAPRTGPTTRLPTPTTRRRTMRSPCSTPSASSRRRSSRCRAARFPRSCSP